MGHAMTTVTTSAEFCRNFSYYERHVREEPVEIRSDDSVTGYFVSPEDFLRVKMILDDARKPYHPQELPDELVAAIRNAKMDDRHDCLNYLMEGL